jgi:heat shock protein HslJ
MKTFSAFFLLAFVFLFNNGIIAQRLQPGFDKAEYIEMLKISARFGAPDYVAAFPAPAHYRFVYRSPIVGLDNTWDLWTHNDNKSAVISIRGTTEKEVSWLANFYAAMVPAKGELKLSEKETFTYELSADPKAAVHVGWLIATAVMSKDIISKIDSCYKKGIKDVIIMGHSQGGAIAYLLTAYVYNLQKQKALPADLRFKTYCSAAPKPGNLYFAYEYEALTQNGWAYNVVNSADWVPEVPISIQTIDDFNVTNPFVGAKGMIKKQKFPKNLALKYAYNQLSKPTYRANRNYQKYLGKMASTIVAKNITGFSAPASYYNSNHYVRTGNTIVLKADENYYKQFPESKEKIFAHHFHPPYLYLTEKLNTNPERMTTSATLDGTWELNFLSGGSTPFDSLYPNKKPTMTFDLKNGQVSGSTGCNRFSGKLNVDGNKLNFSAPMALTKMFCPGEGENRFMEELKKVTAYAINENTLTFIMGDIAVMRFERK